MSATEIVKGRIFNIQRFSVHDGPGIRDSVFVKGCPLRCEWCSNPESQLELLQLAYNKTRCIGCGECIRCCQEQGVGALSLHPEKGVIIDRKACTGCFACVEHCCAQAMHVYGEDVTVDDVMERTLHRQTSWRANGGITVSGGEVLLHAEFVTGLLKRVHGLGVHTAIETSLYGPWEKLKTILEYCDLVFCDLKFADSERHRRHTGVPNELIKDNLQKMRTAFPALHIIVRTPVVPGISDDEENIQDIAAFLKDIPVDDYELLAFHNFGAQKYEQLGRDYGLKYLGNVQKSDILPYNNMIREKLGLPVVQK